MSQDTDFLNHLGELAILKNAIACWFYQGALDNGPSTKQIFAEIVESHSPEEIRTLRTQIQTLLGRNDEELLSLWDSQSDYIFQSPSDARLFFELFAAALEATK